MTIKIKPMICNPPRGTGEAGFASFCCAREGTSALSTGREAAQPGPRLLELQRRDRVHHSLTKAFVEFPSR